MIRQDGCRRWNQRLQKDGLQLLPFEIDVESETASAEAAEREQQEMVKVEI